MDIEFLLFLQRLREVTGGIFDSLFLQLSVFGEPFYTMLLMSVVYWCIDKAIGTYVLLGWGLNRLANGFLKITACAYRPWIRDGRIQPVEDAIAKATGYSFPSGHTTNATSVLGGAALRLRQGSEMDSRTVRLVRAVLVAIILLIGLSRTWLGVHTPQDVLVAIVVGLGLMVVAGWVVDKVDQKPEADVVVAAVGIATSAILIAYAAFKSYPLDYDAAGTLLVDPQKMAIDSYKNAGWALGISIGWLLERRYVGFSSGGSVLQRCCRALCGGLLFLVAYFPMTDLIKLQVPGGVGSTIACLVQTLTIVLVVPALFTWWERRDN